MGVISMAHEKMANIVEQVQNVADQKGSADSTIKNEIVGDIYTEKVSIEGIDQLRSDALTMIKTVKIFDRLSPEDIETLQDMMKLYAKQQHQTD